MASVLGLPPSLAAVLGVALYVAALLALGIIPAEIREALFSAGSPMSVRTRMSEPESHAQFAEDRILAEIFGDRAEGHCVEVGANDGVTGSASYLFEKRGWQCLLVEPIPALAEEIRKHRACRVVNCAASSREGEATFFVAESVEAVSGLDLLARPRGVDPAGRWHDQGDNGPYRDTRQPARPRQASPSSSS